MRKGKSYHKKHQAIVNDFDNQNEKLKKIITNGNKLYRENFQYKNYYENIKKNIFLD